MGRGGAGFGGVSLFNWVMVGLIICHVELVVSVYFHELVLVVCAGHYGGEVVAVHDDVDGEGES